jgi:1-acyl-sn-glycerol-3-phosphate acyltransferase
MSRAAVLGLDRDATHALPGPRALLRWTGALGATGLVLARVAAGQGRPELLSAWSRRLLGALAVEVGLAGPLPEAQLWVANHLSWLDPMVLMGLRPAGTVAKAEVAGYPILGRGAARAGLRFVDREAPCSRAAALAAFAADLRAGRPMILFPEGTTTRGEALAPLWSGGILAAHALGVPVLPLRLESCDAHYPWTGDEALLPHLAGLAKAPRTILRVVPGAALDPAKVGDAQAFLDAVRAHLEPRP